MKDIKPDICICGIVAIGPNNVIGRDGKMPWHSKKDLAYFKQTTMNYPCIFGKTTYDNLAIKPLPGRLNIVCSSSYKIEQKDNVLRVPSLEEAIKYCGNTERVFVCGGAVVYKYALDKDLIDVMYVTEIHDKQLEQDVRENPDAFTYFPCVFDRSKWRKSKVCYRGVLPEDTSVTKAIFYRYTRIR